MLHSALLNKQVLLWEKDNVADLFLNKCYRYFNFPVFVHLFTYAQKVYPSKGLLTQPISKPRKSNSRGEEGLLINQEENRNDGF